MVTAFRYLGSGVYARASDVGTNKQSNLVRSSSIQCQFWDSVMYSDRLIAKRWARGIVNLRVALVKGKAVAQVSNIKEAV